jgi:hypothetical protein
MLVPSIVVGDAVWLEPNLEASAARRTLLIPDYDPEDPQPCPGDIQPGI